MDEHTPRPVPATTIPGSPRRTRPAPPEAFDDDPRATACADSLDDRWIPAFTRLTTALRVMRERGLDHLLVRDESWQPLVVSEIGVLRRLAATASFAGPQLPETVLAVGWAVPRLGTELRRSRLVAAMAAADSDVALLVEGTTPVGVVTPRTLVRSLAPAAFPHRRHGSTTS